MKSNYSLALIAVAGSLFFSCASLRAVETDQMEVARQGGTSILNYNFTIAMMKTGVDSNARGKINGTFSSEGNFNLQKLKISLANLDPNTTYLLTAFLGDNTNSIDVTGFTTGTKGGFMVDYAKRSQGNINPSSEPLPDVLDPMCNIRELAVVNGNLETVLMVDLTNPDQGNYLIKRLMNNTGLIPAAAGKLQIHASSSATEFRLQASGLNPRMDYLLVINGNVLHTNRSDKTGKLIVNNLPKGSPNVLGIQTVVLVDKASAGIVLISAGLGIPCIEMGAQAAAPLGAAANFAILAGSTVANTGPTIINGDLGLSPGSAVTGFPPGVVNGTQHVADTTADQAKLDLTVAYNDAAGRTVAPVSVAGNIGGLTLPPGLYKSTSSLEISSGDLTLDAQGDANAVFIFQIASTLTTTAGRQVVLSGGAKAANVFWQVGTSATLGTTTIFKGTIMADQAITLQTGATLDGRALARIAAVTLDSNIVTIPAP